MRPNKNALEWTVFAASIAVIGGLLALLFVDAAGSVMMRPDLIVALGEPVPVSGGHLVAVTVTNRGGATAEQARIEVALAAGGKTVETAELTIAFVPRRSQREGWVHFRRNPKCCALSARAVSFERP